MFLHLKMIVSEIDPDPGGFLGDGLWRAGTSPKIITSNPGRFTRRDFQTQDNFPDPRALHPESPPYAKHSVRNATRAGISLCKVSHLPFPEKGGRPPNDSFRAGWAYSASNKASAAAWPAR